MSDPRQITVRTTPDLLADLDVLLANGAKDRAAAIREAVRMLADVQRKAHDYGDADPAKIVGYVAEGHVVRTTPVGVRR